MLIVCGADCETALAQSDDVAALFEPSTVVSVGALGGVGPRFQGARRAGLWGLPYLSFRRADEAPEWWSPDDGLDATLIGEAGAQAGAVLDFRDGRSTRDAHRLVGLPGLPLTVGVGVFGEVWPVANTVRLRAEVTQGLRAHDGLLAKIAVDLVARTGRFTLSVGPRLVLGDAASMRLDFDVPFAASVANPMLTPYRATPGLRSVGASGSLAYDWSEAWQTIAYARYDRLVAAAAASPIVRRFGTENQVSFGLGAIYAFRTAGI
ncbi:MipA/OmpV family protein [Methylobacterium sp. BTF04]|uniref:MipA/OmpV family protein n=1 Tax=Methylobacterium sp. BTF04 TaxID=2708300 RepID=UPI0013D73216|nr:MipA/OmpV family protein [Methylobacterium sp. BTF04]NEU10835.1 MipA/OmpV family protein [Methylobacterium sp. BTF04]